MLNYDNDESKLLVDHCYRTTKTLVNPIIDWEEEDVWDFLNSNGIEHCSLYDEGFKRLGCIGCPLSGSRNMERDFARWPKYKELYIKTFQRMIDNHPGDIKVLNPNEHTKFKLENSSGGGYNVDGVVDQILSLNGESGHHENGLTGTSTEQTDENYRGVQRCRSYVQKMAQSCTLLNSSSMTGNETAEAGHRLSNRRSAEVIFTHWVELGAI